MDSHTARRTLSMIWVIIFSAIKGPLKEDEVRELCRLCRLIERGVPGREEFNERAEGFCLMMFSGGVLENRNVRDVGDLLLKIDELRDLLK